MQAERLRRQQEELDHLLAFIKKIYPIMAKTLLWGFYGLQAMVYILVVPQVYAIEFMFLVYEKSRRWLKLLASRRTSKL